MSKTARVRVSKKFSKAMRVKSNEDDDIWYSDSESSDDTLV